MEFSIERPKAVFLIIDAKVGLTDLDREMLKILKENKHQIVIVANKIDKLGKVARGEHLSLVKEEVGDILVSGYSAKTNEGREELIQIISSFL